MIIGVIMNNMKVENYKEYGTIYLKTALEVYAEKTQKYYDVRLEQVYKYTHCIHYKVRYRYLKEEIK